MLTIREPIKLKCGRPIQAMHQDMTARMQANYGLMNLSIRKEELLHITSQPAEIYLADSENFQILTNVNNQNNQEVRLEVINNLMNRIMVAQTENFTYQDTVYISSILRKLGIRDEKTFMKQVFALQNEHKETRQLLQKYESNQELLQQLLISEDTKKEGKIIHQEEITEQKLRYYIHDEIYHRLKTDKIYQDMRQFTKTYYHESNQIYPREMQVAEQTKQAQNLQLQNIKSEIIGKVTPLQYLSHNRYEYLQEITESMTLELEEQITAAILLNLAEQSYVLRQNQIEENSHYWYSIANSLFQTAENTWKRYETNLTERKHFSSEMQQVLEEVKEVKHLEGEIISNIVEEYYRNLQQWKDEHNVKQSFLMQKMIQQAEQPEVHFSGGSYHLTQEEFQLNFLNQEETQEETESFITTEQLQKQLELYNQKNYENYLKIKEIEKQQINVKDRKVNRRKAQIDALRALENPEEVLIEYLTAENEDPVAEAREKMNAQIYELFSEETKEIYRQYLAQNKSEHNTFLEQIMNQSQADEIREEVIQVLGQVEKQEEVVKTKKEVATTLQQQKLLVTQNVKEKVIQQLNLWKKIQEYPISDLEETIYLQSRAKEVFHTEETVLKHLKEEIEKENYLKSVVIGKITEDTEMQLTLLESVKEEVLTATPETEYIQSRIQELILLKDIQESKVDEAPEKEHLQSSVEKTFSTQELRLKQLKDELESEEYLKSSITKSINENAETQLTLLKDVREERVIESQKTEYLQSKAKEEFQTQEVQFKHLKDEIEAEKYLKSTVNRTVDENIEIQMTLLKDIQEGVVNEIPKTEYIQSRMPEQTLLPDIPKGVVNETPEVEYLQNQVEKIFSTQELRLKQLKDELENEKYLKSSITKSINENVETQLTLLKDVREERVIESQETEYLQSKAKEEFQIQEVQFKHLKEEIESEKRLESAIVRKENEETQLTLLKDVQEIAEIDFPKRQYLQEEKEETFQTQKIQYTQLKENVEKQIKRQREEMTVVNAAVQKEVRRQQVEFVHKKEEQLVNEELLEEIREQSQKTVKTQQTEETTVQNNKEVHQVIQDSVNRIQTNRVEDIEQIVQQSVKRQLNHLSEQVYSKLEKKLETERKRRGYF